MVRLWIHECNRTYSDRLVNHEHVRIFKENLFDIVKKNFPRFNFAKYFHKDNPENLIFCNFTAGISSERFYD